MNKSMRLFIFIILISLLSTSLKPSVPTRASAAPLLPAHGIAIPTHASVDLKIYAQLERQGTAQVLVILHQNADLSAASRLPTKTEKGTYVYQQLTKLAQQTQAPLRSLLDSQGAEYQSYWIQNMLRVSLDETLLAEIAHQPGVERIESYTPPGVEPFENVSSGIGPIPGPFPPAPVSTQPDRSLGTVASEFSPDFPSTVEWNIQRVGAPDVWAMGYTGTGAVVGVLDTGVEWTHPALVNHYRLQIPGAPTRHDYNWFDGIGGVAVPQDYFFHGTYSMGTIVGDDGAGIQIGMAPGAKWIACAGSGSPNVDPFECYQWFLAPTKLDGTDPRPDLAPDVINQVFPSPKDYHTAVQALYAAGIYITQPAGNNGPQCYTSDLPMGQYPEVTATAAFDNTDNIKDFSARGPVLIRHKLWVKPDIAAPGFGVRASIPARFGLYLDDGRGTSIAAPHVAGAVALLISAVPELRGRVDLIDMILKTNAEPKASSECTPGGGVPNNVWGWGILNVHQAVLAAQALELGGIEGQLVDAGSLQPLEDVKLTITDSTLDWPYPDRSDSLGEYEHTLPAGTYTLTASLYGYLDGLVSDVNISPGVTTTLDIELNPAPIWTVGGAVTDSQTGEPLVASISLEGTPASTTSDPQTGSYSLAAAQGEWWLVVTSPGYAEWALKLDLDHDQMLNISIDPIFNYAMRSSLDGGCGPQFDWQDAKTGGTPRTVDWETPVFVPLPAGETFNFYGNTYNGFYINAHGMLTFGFGYGDMGNPIPNPARPNNTISAFSTFLNPASFFGGGGTVYTKYIDTRYFVIEWYQVVHWADHDPETFEIILDLQTNRIKLQYLTVGDATGVIVGVENSTGTEATLYAYDEPGLITNNTAVEFFPIFGARLPSGAAGELLGTVTDQDTGLPIGDSLVTAVAATTGLTFTDTTTLSGAYSALLCADFYTVTAEATGYYPDEEPRIPVYPAEQTIQNFALLPLVYPPLSVMLSGPTAGWMTTPSTFTASVEPPTTTLPLTYTWQVDDQLPIIHTGGLTDTLSLAWEDPGTHTITVLAGNLAGSVMDTHPITIDLPMRPTYLPLVTRTEAPLSSVTNFPAHATATFAGLCLLGLLGRWKKGK